MSIATNESTKRLRIDPNTMPSTNTTMNNTRSKTADSTKSPATPTAAASQHIDVFVESLYPQLSNIIPRIAKEHLKLLRAHHKKKQDIAKFEECIRIAEANEPGIEPKWPRSANLKFALANSADIDTNPDFVTLKQQSQDYVKGVKITLTKYILGACQISLKTIEQNINASLAHALFNSTIAYLKGATNDVPDSTNLNTEAHKIVNTLLDSHHETLLQFSVNTDLQTFRDGYKATHSLDRLPNPVELQVALSPARRNRSTDTNTSTEMIGDSIGLAMIANTTNTQPAENARQQRSGEQTRILTIKNMIVSTLIRPYKIFLEQSNTLSKAVALKELETSLFTSSATDAAAMLVDNEATPNPQQLQELITKSVASATANLQSEIRQLKSKLDAHSPSPPRRNNKQQQAKNQLRGRSRSQNRGRPRSQSRGRRGASSKRNSNRNKNNNRSRKVPNDDVADGRNNATTGDRSNTPKSRRNRSYKKQSSTRRSPSKTKSNRQRRQSKKS